MVKITILCDSTCLHGLWAYRLYPVVAQGTYFANEDSGLVFSNSQNTGCVPSLTVVKIDFQKLKLKSNMGK